MVRRSLFALAVGFGMVAFPGVAPAQPADGVTERVVPDAEYQRLRQRIDLSIGGRASPLALPYGPYAHPHPGYGYGPYPYGSYGYGSYGYGSYGYGPYGYGYGYGYGPYALPPYYESEPAPPTSTPLEIGPITPAGRVTVQVEPPDAEVLVDGHPLRRRGNSPHQVGLLVGTHRVEVRAPGHEDHRQDVEVRAGSATNLTIRLQPSRAR